MAFSKYEILDFVGIFVVLKYYHILVKAIAFQKI